MGNQSYEGLSDEQLAEMRNFDRGVRSASTKLGLARRAVITEASRSRGKTEMEKLMTAKYGRFFTLFARLSEESQQALIEKASNFNLKPDGTEREFFELMADLNRYALSLAPEDDPPGELKKEPDWRGELKEVATEMERLKAEKHAAEVLRKQGEKEEGSGYVN